MKKRLFYIPVNKNEKLIRIAKIMHENSMKYGKDVSFEEVAEQLNFSYELTKTLFALQNDAIFIDDVCSSEVDRPYEALPVADNYASTDFSNEVINRIYNEELVKYLFEKANLSDYEIRIIKKRLVLMEKRNIYSVK